MIMMGTGLTVFGYAIVPTLLSEVKTESGADRDHIGPDAKWKSTLQEENMRQTVVLLTMLSVMLFAGTGASAMKHEATVDKGKALFNDPKLGTTGTTCNDCHKDGAGLAPAAERKDLEAIVNGCIKANLKGKALKPKSVEMQSLLLYIRSMGAVKQPAEKKKAVGH